MQDDVLLDEQATSDLPVVDESVVDDSVSDESVTDVPAAVVPSQDIVADIVQSVQDIVQDVVSGDADAEEDVGQDDDTTVDGVMSSYYGGYMSGYLSGLEDGVPADVEAPAELVDIQTYALSPITSSSGLKGVLLDVLGPYDNVVTQYKYQQANNSYYTYVNEITPDYPWIGSCLLFTAMVVCLFQLIRRMLGWLQ